MTIGAQGIRNAEPAKDRERRERGVYEVMMVCEAGG